MTHFPQDTNTSSWISTADNDGKRRISIRMPTSFLTLPPAAALVGMVIGMSRGGSKARLRFLAENAHRPPTTVQGWYFYTKTRNYRIFFSAVRTGARYALALGGATFVYVLMDESIGYTREQIVGYKIYSSPSSSPWRESRGLDNDGREIPRRIGWREGGVSLWDGGITGSLLGLGVATVYRLPRPLFIRATTIGTIMGTATSALQIIQAKIGEMRTQDISQSTSMRESPTQTITDPLSDATRSTRQQETAPVPVDYEVDEIPILADGLEDTVSSSGGWSRLWTWIPGLGKS